MTEQSLCPKPLLLQEFARGTISPSGARAVQRHLLLCKVCAAVLEGLASEELATRCIRRSGSGERPEHVEAADQIEVAASASSSFAFLRPPAGPDEIGRIGEYRFLGLLGSGGMGVVFRAEDIALRRAVALKVVRPGLGDEARSWDRFLREARMLASVKHDHVVTVYHAGQEGEVVYLAMELLEGKSVADLLAPSPPVGVAEVIRIARETAAGLSALHRHGLIHRDIKPSNIWIESPPAGAPDQPGRVKILDLGLARSAHEDDPLTLAGMVVGTPSYMSPEQARGDPLDARSDLFSLGCVLYALCTGQEPFPGKNTMARLTALAVSEPRSVRELSPSVPRPLAQLITDLLAKDADERPASADEVVARLRHMEDIPGPRASTSILREESRPPSRSAKRRKRSGARPTRRVSRRALTLVLGVLLGAGLLAVALALRTRGTATNGQAPQKAYLDDLTPVASLDWPLRAPPGAPPPPDHFQVISIRGERFPHCIGMHASPRGKVSVSYALGKKYDTFSAGASLNDSSPGSAVPMTFCVHGDGKLLWQSNPLTFQADGQNVSVPVKDVDVLTLSITNPEGGPDSVMGAHGVWIHPAVLKGE